MISVMATLLLFFLLGCGEALGGVCGDSSSILTFELHNHIKFRQQYL